MSQRGGKIPIYNQLKDPLPILKNTEGRLSSRDIDKLNLRIALSLSKILEGGVIKSVYTVEVPSNSDSTHKVSYHV